MWLNIILNCLRIQTLVLASAFHYHSLHILYGTTSSPSQFLFVLKAFLFHIFFVLFLLKLHYDQRSESALCARAVLPPSVFIALLLTVLCAISICILFLIFHSPFLTTSQVQHAHTETHTFYSPSLFFRSSALPSV